MKVIKTEIDGLLEIEPTVFGDSRGYFFEVFNKKTFKEKTGLVVDFVQDNQSMSQKGVLRGLHFQSPPHAQGKLVTVTKGAVLDIALDIRKDSPTYGKHLCFELNEENKKMVYIPEGFAHGFLTLEDNTIFTYKCTDYYNKDSEGGILITDEELNLPINNNGSFILSEKDKIQPLFKDFISPF